MLGVKEKWASGQVINQGVKVIADWKRLAFSINKFDKGTERCKNGAFDLVVFNGKAKTFLQAVQQGYHGHGVEFGNGTQQRGEGCKTG